MSMPQRIAVLPRVKAETTSECDVHDTSPGVWTMLVVTASCVVVLVGMVAWPSIDMSIVALCVPVYWLGRTCWGAYLATRPDRPSRDHFLPALIGSFGVLLIFWALLGGLVGAAGMIVRTFLR